MAQWIVGSRGNGSCGRVGGDGGPSEDGVSSPSLTYSGGLVVVGVVPTERRRCSKGESSSEDWCVGRRLGCFRRWLN